MIHEHLGVLKAKLQVLGYTDITVEKLSRNRITRSPMFLLHGSCFGVHCLGRNPSLFSFTAFHHSVSAFAWSDRRSLEALPSFGLTNPGGDRDIRLSRRLLFRSSHQTGEASKQDNGLCATGLPCRVLPCRGCSRFVRLVAVRPSCTRSGFCEPISCCTAVGTSSEVAGLV